MLVGLVSPTSCDAQAETKDGAFESLKQAVELWFESCIERGVLDEALNEVGFHPIKPGERVPENASVFEVKRPSRAIRDNFTTSEDFEVTIPAYVVAKQLSRVRPVDWDELVALCESEKCVYDRQKGGSLHHDPPWFKAPNSNSQEARPQRRYCLKRCPNTWTQPQRHRGTTHSQKGQG